MNQEKLVDRYELLESILTFYNRLGKSQTLIKHIFRFIGNNLRVRKEDRIELFEYLFKHQWSKENKKKNFIF